MMNKRILIVDDDPDFVDSVRAVLEANHYDVDVAYDGMECLQKVPGFKPDLIVLDVMMPAMNGHETCRKLRADKATHQIPIILLTAVADNVSTTSYTHHDMLVSDADDYIPKPVEPEELLKSILVLL